MPFAIATGHALTTEAAENILRAGGTAVDALVAAAFTAFVAEPILAGPLGGGAALIEEPGKAPAILDAFVQTPRRKAPEADLDLETITVDFGAETQDFHIGAATIATPCLIPALSDLHARLGRIPLPELAAQAVAHARQGHIVTAFQSHVLHLVGPIIESAPAPKALYGGETLLTPGQTLRNPQLADVLETLALEGPRFFTEGEIAQALIALPGGHLSLEDLRHAAPVRRQPL
ncbi:MAG: gamma-glutamyltransferase, partial [Pseudomonadota bacterium]